MRRNRALARVGIVAATVGMLPATIAVLWAFGWYSGVAGARAAEAPAGVTEGQVWKADPQSRTVRVTSNPFGIGAIPFTVVSDTRVVVGDKEGGFGDLAEGAPVRITYERRDAVLIARCVEAITWDESGDGGRCPVRSVEGPPPAAGVASLDLPAAR